MDEFSRKVLQSVVAQVCSQLGWHSIHATPLDIMVDLLHRHLKQICVQTHRYSEQFNQTQPNLDHLGLAFEDLGVQIQDLEEFVKNVESMPLPYNVPKYPLPKESHLNFLKPGSNEVVHRPVHVHEHLPPMHPDLEENSKNGTNVGEGGGTGDLASGGPMSPNASGSPVFKRPSDLLESPAMKRVRLAMEEEGGGRPLREISSVIMTTSGFLSPAREGKLPESKPPVIPSEYLEHPKPPPPPTALATPGSKSDKKKQSMSKNLLNAKKKEVPTKKKEAPKPPIPKVEKREEPPPPKKKKVTSMKELDKLKALKQITVRKLPPAPTMPTEKLLVDPDKQKLNIFKKIPKVKDEAIKNSPRESSPSVTITEVGPPKHEEARRLANIDSVIDSVLSEPKIEMVVEEEVILSDTFSPPSTPSAPKTPEILSKADRMAEKRRKREKKQKSKAAVSVTTVEEEDDDIIMEGPIDRPRTPEILPPAIFPFMSRFPTPGLIPPPPMTSPLLSGLPFPGKEPTHPAMPNMPMPPPTFMHPKSLEVEAPSESVTEEVIETEVIVEKSKEHKKEKKEEKKVKKKKDKKDKNKNKEKGEKKRDEKKVKEKKDKKEKRKEREKIVLKISDPRKRDERADTSSPAIPKLTLKLAPASPRPPTPDAPRKLVIKPIVMKEEEPPENPPELAKFAPLITRPPKPPKVKEEPKKTPPLLPPAPVPETVAFYIHDGSQHKSKSRRRPSSDAVATVDEAGNKIWICPACKGPDDCTPMIGCDDCDAWYHWACVGIQVPPDEDVSWYCKECIVRKQSSFSDKKKKKVKKKV
ncbi:transcription initiation factor TFIID subunit 3 isoform X2 [Neocloeon triangulifer]|uniref:transcription initiation factor TFIID subunit 3 isoform X2 n=1 Tax=Neocloeon triangulifer TaxID=2078957 RepID=UPI00286F1E6C|nr:transcription initiation factor TFIID subunit 3 isoform X2 [Neocloeon triangulifer]